MPKVLHRYLLGRLLGTLVATETLFVGIMLFLSLAQYNRKAQQLGFDFLVILQSVVYLIPYILSLTLPIALLVAVVVTFGRLVDRNEFTAIKAAGVSPYWLIGPVLLVGAAVTAATLLASDKLVESSLIRLRANILDSVQESLRRSATPGRSLDLTLSGGASIKLNFLQPDATGRKPVSVAIFEGDRPGRSFFAADHEIKIRDAASAEGGDLTRTEVSLTLYEGESFQDPLRVSSFAEFRKDYTIPSTAANKLSVGNSATHRSIQGNLSVQREEAARAETARTGLLERTADLLGRSVSAGELGPGEPARIADDVKGIEHQRFLLRKGAKRASDAEIAVHRRIAQAFSALSFVLLGMAIGLRYGSGGSVKAGLIALVVLVTLYYIPLLALRSAARSGWHPVIIWIPTALLALIGAGALRRTFERS